MIDERKSPARISVHGLVDHANVSVSSMKAKNIHQWTVSPKEAVEIQKRLVRLRVFCKGPDLSDISYVAGADISIHKETDDIFVSVVVLEFPSLAIIEESYSTGRAGFPYVPGLLSFREAPMILDAFEKLSIKPDILIVDGQGIAHPRGIGLATHLGILLDMPTIGCAKSLLVGKYKQPGKEAGSYSSLIDKEGKEIGIVLRTRSNVSPVFVSIGNMTDLRSCRKTILACCTKYRLPKPTRQAHILSNKLRSRSS